LDLVDDIWRAGLALDVQILVSAWADQHRVLGNLSAEPGRWRTSRVPYLREPMDCLSTSSGVEKTILMKGAQVGATETALNFIGYAMEHSGGLTLLVMPTLSDVRKNTRVRINPMIEASPSLRAIVATPRSRSATNTTFEKEFRGGILLMGGANSASALSSTPVKFLLCDEIDRWPHDVDGEGDPLALAVQRTATFRAVRKIFMASTPTIAGVSRIEKAFAEGDQRHYFVPCPHCSDMAVMTWARIRWPEGRPERAACACDACGALASEADKGAMLSGGEWRPTATAADPKVRSYHLPALLSPFETWGEQAVEFLASKNDPLRLQAWTNLKLGEPFEDRETTPVAADALMARAVEAEPDWSMVLPDGVAAITVGCDVQQDRVELETVGWGAAERSWSISYDIVFGDTSGSELWSALDRLLLRRFRHPRDVPDLAVMATCIDAGFRTDQVMAFAAPRAGRRAWATKGRSAPGVPSWPRLPPKRRPGRLAPVFIVGVDPLKMTLTSRLRIAEDGPGFCAFPADRERDWFEGITSERAIRKFTRGIGRIVWLHDPGTINEPLDCRIYAMAALHGARAAGFSLADAAARVAAAARRFGAAEPKRPVRPGVIRSSWMNR
jgi:phage terminase large subunit GpA-like protein